MTVSAWAALGPGTLVNALHPSVQGAGHGKGMHLEADGRCMG